MGGVGWGVAFLLCENGVMDSLIFNQGNRLNVPPGYCGGFGKCLSSGKRIVLNEILHMSGGETLQLYSWSPNEGLIRMPWICISHPQLLLAGNSSAVAD